MTVWPTWPWILLLISGRLGSVRPRDFTAEDIILLHPSTTPHPGAFKCFTCEEAVDNYECNRWAPDVYCPKSTKYCYTLHVMDGGGETLTVTKRCVAPESCRSTGCVNVTGGGYQTCASCCQGDICNILVPRNDSSAVFSSAAPLAGSGRGLRPAALLHFIFIGVIVVVGNGGCSATAA